MEELNNEEDLSTCTRSYDALRLRTDRFRS